MAGPKPSNNYSWAWFQSTDNHDTTHLVRLPFVWLTSHQTIWFQLTSWTWSTQSDGQRRIRQPTPYQRLPSTRHRSDTRQSGLTWKRVVRTRNYNICSRYLLCKHREKSQYASKSSEKTWKLKQSMCCPSDHTWPGCPSDRILSAKAKRDHIIKAYDTRVAFARDYWLTGSLRLLETLKFLGYWGH